MPNRVEQPFAEVSTGQMNTVNDTVAGGTLNAAGQAQYAGTLGQRIWLDGTTTGGKYNPAIGTVYGGEFQYVRIYLSSTATPTLGYPVAWAWDQDNSCFEDYTVTTDCNSALRTGRIAGILLSAPTKGNYTWIQVSGKATVQFVTSLTAATPADGDLLIVASASGLVDDLTQTTQPTMAQLKAVIGTAIGAPVSNTTGLCLLRRQGEVV